VPRRADTSTPAPPSWRSPGDELAANEVLWGPAWCGRDDERQRPDELPRSVPTEGDGDGRRQRRQEVNYSSPGDNSQKPAGQEHVMRRMSPRASATDG